jgi:periplasmic divalent cation tolerance protein
MASEYIAVLITAPNEEMAVSIAQALVSERLAACANIVPGVRSIYRWEGALHDEPEVLMVVKTRRALFDALAARVTELHEYTVPEVIALSITDGSAPYLAWIGQSVGPK